MSELISVKWDDERQKLLLLDETLLPSEIKYKEYCSVKEVYEAIKNMVVTKSEAIGIAAAYGFYFAVKKAPENNFDNFYEYLEEKGEYLKSSKPTVMKLGIIEYMRKKLLENKDKDIMEIKSILGEETKRIHEKYMA